MKYNAVEGMQPSVIRWARESIGLSLDEVAVRLKRQVEEVQAWEEGEATPTYPQLEKLAYDIYKRPIALFFLPEPPTEPLPRTEFRTLPAADLEHLLPDTRLHIRKAHAYQLALAELFDNRNPSKRRIWEDHAIQHTGDTGKLAKQIRQYLGIDIEVQSQWRTADKAIKAWRNAIEAKGIFIFKAAFKQKDISGFCLADEQLPVIYINNSTSKTRQVFSLLHELCHLLMHENGLSKFDHSYIEFLPKNVQKIERLCNALAAAILIPAEDFVSQSSHLPHMLDSVDDEEIVRLANRYGVSREVILRRFLDQKRVGITYYEQKAKEWAAQQKKGKGGDWYATTNTYLSERFATEVVSRHYRNQLSVEHAADLLGIKAKNFEGLEQRILQGALA